MFAFFSARPPLTTGQRVNLQMRCRRAMRVHRKEWITASKTLISIDSITAARSSPQENVDAIATDLADRFGVQNDRLEFDLVDKQTVARDLFDEHYVYQPAQDNHGARVLLNAEIASVPENLVTTIANGFSHHVWHLHSDHASDYDSADVWLLPILVGLGVVIADASFQEHFWFDGGWSGWSMGRMGCYNAMEIGYVMALVSSLQSDARPPNWLKTLRLDGRATAKQTLKYLRFMNESGKHILVDAPEVPSPESRTSELTRWLVDGDPDWALCAGQVLYHRLSEAAAEGSSAVSIMGRDKIRLIESAIEVTGSKDPELVAMATRLLGPLGEGASGADLIKTKLKKLSGHHRPAIALAAMESATQIGMPHQHFLTTAKRLLGNTSFDALPVIEWISAGGKQCSPLEETVCEVLQDALLTEHEPTITAVTDCLKQISDNAETILKERFQDNRQLGSDA